MKSIRLLIWPLLIAAFGVGGCNTPAKFADVSSDPAYRSHVGAVYVLKVAMHISGVNAPPGYEKTVDYYVINPISPSWSGPELITRDSLPAGTEIKVESVRRCTNCILDFGERVEAVVRIPTYRTPSDLPIRISLDYLDVKFAEKKAAF